MPEYLISNGKHYYSRARPNTRMQSDRFAREILAILECDSSRSRRLMRNPLGGSSSMLRQAVSFSQHQFIRIPGHGESRPPTQETHTATNTLEGMLVALPEAMPDHIVELLVQFLLPYNTWAGLNALIRAQYGWLALHFGDDNAIALKQQASASYGQMVGEVVAARRYHRRQVPAGQGLPDLHSNTQIERAFADKALAYLQDMPFDTGLAVLASVHGTWILSCPEAVIRQAPEFASSIRTARTDDDLIQLMLEALEFCIILGHGG